MILNSVVKSIHIYNCALYNLCFTNQLKILSFVAMHRFKYEWTLVSAMELYFLFKSWSAYSAGEKLRSQCPRTYLNKRFLPRQKLPQHHSRYPICTAWKPIPHRSKIQQELKYPHWVTIHRFLLIKKQLYSNYIEIHFT